MAYGDEVFKSVRAVKNRSRDEDATSLITYLRKTWVLAADLRPLPVPDSVP